MQTQKTDADLRNDLTRFVIGRDAQKFLWTAEQLIERGLYSWDVVEQTLRHSELLVRRFDSTDFADTRKEFLETVKHHLKSAAPRSLKKFNQTIALGVKLERLYRSQNLAIDYNVARMPKGSLANLVLGYAREVAAGIPENVIRDGALGSFGMANLEIGGNVVDLDGAVEVAVAGIGELLVTVAYREGQVAKDRLLLQWNTDFTIEECQRFEKDVSWLAELAVGRHQWTQCEQRIRFYDGKVESFESLFEDDCWKFIRAKINLSAVQGLLQVARRRILARATQLYNNTIFEDSPSIAPLPPDGHLDKEELISALLLAQELGFEKLDASQFAGLTLGEWLRGYKVLKMLWCLEEVVPVERSAITSTLVEHGLTEAHAELFIDHVTFKASSQDLFENPLVQLEDNRLVPVRLALEYLSLPVTVYSRINREKLDQRQKGKRFEKRVLELFARNNVPGVSFKETTDNGEQYEFDAVVSWGGYLFVFEAKSRFLAPPWAALEHRFQERLNGAVEQTQRLRSFLVNHPEIVKSRCGGTFSAENIIPCVIFSCTFASEPIDGVCICDFSWLQRFFESPEVNIVDTTSPTDGASTVHKLWRSEHPEAEDLKRHLRINFAQRFWTSLLKTRTKKPPVPIGQNTRLVYEYLSFTPPI